jgi:hypothetical protein
MVTRRVLLVLGILASLSACGDDDTTGPPPAPTLTGVTWELKCIGPAGRDVCYDPDLNATYTIRFETSGTVSGTNACNTCEGTYSYASPRHLEIHWSCTEAACGTPPPWLGYESAVSSITSFVLTDAELVLMSADQGGDIVLLIHERAN